MTSTRSETHGNSDYPGGILDGNYRAVRLLTLLPGNGGTKIICTLRSASLETIENYETLSYEWGDPEPSQTIFVNDKEFKIGENLFQAL
jgi:hypothetical protein